MKSFVWICLGALLGAPILVFAQWQALDVHSTANFRSVHVADENTVWIGGTAGTILKSENAGLSWKQISPPSSDSLDFRSVVGFPGGKKAVAMSIGEAEKGKARIYYTEDGGENWRLTFSTNQKGVFLNCLGFWDDQNGLCMGDPIDGRFYLLRTRDGGKSWEETIPSHRPKSLPGEIAFAASGSTLHMGEDGLVLIGTGGMEKGRLFRSQDQGVSWAVVETPIQGGASAGIFGIYFWNRHQGIVLGGDYKKYTGNYSNMALSNDGGTSWVGASLTLPPGLKESATMFAGQYLIVVGHSGSSYSTDQGRSWVALDQQPYHAVSSFGETAIAVGVKGLVQKFVRP